MPGRDHKCDDNLDASGGNARNPAGVDGERPALAKELQQALPQTRRGPQIEHLVEAVAQVSQRNNFNRHESTSHNW